MKKCLLILFLPIPVFAGSAPVNYWNDWQLDYKLYEGLKFKAEQENWYDSERFYLEETILELEYRFCPYFVLAAGDRFVDEKKIHDGKRQWRYENRPTLDLLFNTEYAGFKFDWRNRYEWRDKEGADFEYLRFRNRFRVRTPWKWTDWEIGPYASWEFYYEAKDHLDKGRRFNRTRALLGLSMKPAEHVTISVFYLLQHSLGADSGWQPVSVPGLEIKFDF